MNVCCKVSHQMVGDLVVTAEKKWKQPAEG